MSEFIVVSDDVLICAMPSRGGFDLNARGFAYALFAIIGRLGGMWDARYQVRALGVHPQTGRITSKCISIYF
jgi:hypothetical protein